MSNHAVVQQLRDIKTTHTTSSYSLLQGTVSQYIQHQNEIEYIHQFRTMYDITLNVEHNHTGWIINVQSYNGTYATELVF